MYRVAIGARLGVRPGRRGARRALLPSCGRGTLQRELAGCLCALGIMAVYRDVYPEAVAFSEVAQIARAIGDELTESGALMDLGFARLLLDDPEAARKAFEAADVLAEAGQPASARTPRASSGCSPMPTSATATMHLHMEATGCSPARRGSGRCRLRVERANLSAYGMEEYEEALRLGRAGYEAFSKVNHRWGKIAALCGSALPRWGSATSTRLRTLRTPRSSRHDSSGVSLELLALSGAGAVLREKGEREQAGAAHVRTRPRAAPSLMQLRGTPGARGSRGRATSSSSPPPGAWHPRRASKTSSHWLSGRTRAPFTELRAWPPRLSLDRAPPKPIWLPSTSR